MNDITFLSCGLRNIFLFKFFKCKNDEAMIMHKKKRREIPFLLK